MLTGEFCLICVSEQNRNCFTKLSVVTHDRSLQRQDPAIIMYFYNLRYLVRLYEHGLTFELYILFTNRNTAPQELNLEQVTLKDN